MAVIGTEGTSPTRPNGSVAVRLTDLSLSSLLLLRSFSFPVSPVFPLPLSPLSSLSSSSFAAFELFPELPRFPTAVAEDEDTALDPNTGSLAVRPPSQLGTIEDDDDDDDDDDDEDEDVLPLVVSCDAVGAGGGESGAIGPPSSTSVPM